MMQRKDFIKTCGLVCLGGTVFSAFMQSCTSTKILNGNIKNSDLVVPISDFEIIKKGEKIFRKYIIIHNEQLQFPICVYRLSEEEYSALWMRCTHQGAELQVFGDKLQCPAHGSEFSNKGFAQTGPADISLRSFPARIENNQLKISLKA